KMENFLDFEMNVLKTGDVIEATVVALEDTVAYLDVNFATEAALSLADYAIVPPTSFKGILAVGDTVKVKVVFVKDEEVRVSRRDFERQAQIEALSTFAESNTAFDITITRAIKGGVLGTVNGTEVFVPASQVSLTRIEDLSSVVGKTFKAVFIEFEPAKKKIVASVRKVMAMERTASKKEAFELITLAETVEATVTEFVSGKGVRVMVGTVEGWLPISEVAHTRTMHLDKVLTIGQVISVKVIELDTKRFQITVSAKALVESPWTLAMKTFKVGDVVEGTVARMTDFGAFVTLAEGIDGLIHTSEASYDRSQTIFDMVQADATVQVKVIRIDEKKKQIALSLKQLAQDPWTEALDKLTIGQIVTGKVKNVAEKFAFITVLPHVDGILFDRELTEKPVNQMSDYLSEGQEIEVMIKDINKDRKRLVLSVVQIAYDAEKAAFDAYKEQAAQEQAAAAPVNAFAALAGLKK
ncbi:MAG: S1 RNA-binding domain-containing protein, partial [Culicoidibacterales bacterium]